MDPLVSELTFDNILKVGILFSRVGIIEPHNQLPFVQVSIVLI